MIFKLKANLNELIELLTGLAAASGPKRDLLLTSASASGLGVGSNDSTASW